MLRVTLRRRTARHRSTSRNGTWTCRCRLEASSRPRLWRVGGKHGRRRPSVVLTSPYARAARTAGDRGECRSAFDCRRGGRAFARAGSSCSRSSDSLRHREPFSGTGRIAARIGKFDYRPPSGESWCDAACGSAVSSTALRVEDPGGERVSHRDARGRGLHVPVRDRASVGAPGSRACWRTPTCQRIGHDIHVAEGTTRRQHGRHRIQRGAASRGRRAPPSLSNRMPQVLLGSSPVDVDAEVLRRLPLREISDATQQGRPGFGAGRWRRTRDAGRRVACWCRRAPGGRWTDSSSQPSAPFRGRSPSRCPEARCGPPPESKDGAVSPRVRRSSVLIWKCAMRSSSGRVRSIVRQLVTFSADCSPISRRQSSWSSTRLRLRCSDVNRTSSLAPRTKSR